MLVDLRRVIYPEILLSYLAHAHAVDTRPSFLREGLGTRLGSMERR